MSTTVARMATDELRQMIGAVVEQKLVELLGDPDAGRQLKKAMRWAPAQKAAVASGERGHALEDVVQRLGLGKR